MIRFLTQKWILLTVFILGSAFTTLFLPPPGLTTPEPVGAFLNGAFPADIPPEQVKLTPAYPSITFNSPLTWALHPNDSKIFVGQRDGTIYHFNDDPATTTKTLFLDLEPEVGVVWDGGFLGMVMHPDFGKPGASGRNYFYVYYSTRDGNGGHEPTSPGPQPCKSGAVWKGGYLVLQRYEVNDGTLTVNTANTLTMFKVRLYNTTHRGGGMVFGQDGFLYLTTGDQAEHSVAQDISTNFDGGVLRMDVDMDPSKSHAPVRVMPQDSRGPDEISGMGYFIPNDNPFLSPSGALFEEYYSLGHRNPHRMTMDRLTGIMYIGEIGSATHEEVNILKKGKNYGWPVWEGSVLKNTCLTALYGGMAHELPLVAFPRATANSITGGYVYRGSDIPALYGKYICGDYGNGDEIWSVDVNTGNYTQLITTYNPISFGEDKHGELYVMRQGNNRQLLKMEQDGAPFNPPLTLSATGAFSNLSTLDPANGVVPYDMYESFWSDGAEKQRWMVIPNDGTHDTATEQIKYSENGEWEFPVGAVLIKHFEMPMDETNPSITQRLETRFIIVSNTGKVYGLTYKWRADGTDADLLAASLDENLTITTATGTRQQTWHYPSRSECLTCHNEAVGGTLGPRTRYLNNDHTYPSTGISANQLVTLSHLGILDETILDTNTGGLLSSATKTEPSASLEKRARSYLDLNCGYCHRPGTGNRAFFDARLSTDTYLANFFTDKLNESLGIMGEMVVAPGDTGRSVLFQRIHSTDPAIMMPPLAKGEIDEAGAALIAEWIGSLDPDTKGCEPTNLGMGKSASQSSTLTSSYSLGAENAIDGNTNGDDADNTITHTNSEFQPWWEIDLGAIHSLKGVNLWNRTDCCEDRLNNFYVLVSEVPFTSQNLNTTLGQAGIQAIYFEGEAGRETFIDINGKGRYVRVQLSGTGILTLAEAEIMGCSEEGQGLIANYFDNKDFTNESIKRNDATIDFEWGTGSPSPDMGNNDFSVRWTGEIEAPTTGIYTFYSRTDDGVRVWVDGELIIDKWILQAPTEWTGTILLTAGERVPIYMEFYEQSGGAVAQLSWSGPGVSKEIIPAQNLFPTPQAACDDLSNLAYKQSVSQSSTQSSSYNFDAENAVDGNADSDAANNSVTRTQSESNAWWEVDLGAVQDIDHINIWNRTDCCENNLNDFHVLVSDESFVSTGLAATLAQSEVSDFHYPTYPTNVGRVPVNRTGRYVRVQLSGTNHLSLAEVEVMGCASETPPNDCPAIDFSGYTINSYTSGQDEGSSDFQENGNTLLIQNNAWKYIDFDYTITANTILEFDFRSTIEGEYHAIGMDDNNAYNAARAFKLFGTQNEASDIESFENYNGEAYKHYRIPIGQYYTGAMDRLFFLADHDAAPENGNSLFRNVKVYEDADLDGECDGVRFSLKALLQGPFDDAASLMNDDLRTANELNTTDPYGIGLTAYSGAFFITGSDAITDWLQIELRDATDPTIVVATTAVLLQRDGDAITADGNAIIDFPSVTNGSYFVSIKHYNHLGVMTNAVVNFATTPLIDFSDQATVLYDTGGIPTEMAFGVRLLWSGDANNDGTINAVDKNNFWRIENGQSYQYGTDKADFNLDGVINAVDKNSYWRVNNSLTEQLP